MLENLMNIKQQLLSRIPSVDECLKTNHGERWLYSYPRRVVLRCIRETLQERRKEILNGQNPDVSIDTIADEVEDRIRTCLSYRLTHVINATGVIVHTNLGRSILSDEAIKNIIDVSSSYSNLEYDLKDGKRGERYSHLRETLIELSGAEDGIVVNNNASAVLLCLNTLAKDREVIVSRGELVEIGGSFRIPEVMRASGAILREVGTTNKTHLRDYRDALCGNSALLLKVHQSNYRIIGFTEEVTINELVNLSREFKIPLMVDLGSGCMIDLKRYGIHGEPTVQDTIKAGADLVCFSGDKLLGGPQAGIILGKEWMLKKIKKNPLLRALRVDKMTIAALEATLMQYLDEERVIKEIPTIRMLTESPDVIKKRARRLYNLLKKHVPKYADIEIISETSRAGGGALPEIDLPTYAVSIRPLNISVNMLETRLRHGKPPVISRVKGEALLLDMRTVLDRELKTLAGCIKKAMN
ncbi:MAG: L-seryl-tRNA(Sec) selenium transferase [Thermodesulfovibrionia bacterium]